MTKLQFSHPSEPSDHTTTLRRFDVLMGRGLGVARHFGNAYFRHLVDWYRDTYNEAKKFEKGRISSGIVLKIHHLGGRFVQKIRDGTYKQVSFKKAVIKTSQALRELFKTKERELNIEKGLSFSPKKDILSLQKKVQKKPSFIDYHHYHHYHHHHQQQQYQAVQMKHIQDNELPLQYVDEEYFCQDASKIPTLQMHGHARDLSQIQSIGGYLPSRRFIDPPTCASQHQTKAQRCSLVPSQETLPKENLVQKEESKRKDVTQCHRQFLPISFGGKPVRFSPITKYSSAKMQALNDASPQVIASYPYCNEKNDYQQDRMNKSECEAILSSLPNTQSGNRDTKEVFVSTKRIFVPSYRTPSPVRQSLKPRTLVKHRQDEKLGLPSSATTAMLSDDEGLELHPSSDMQQEEFRNSIEPIGFYRLLEAMDAAKVLDFGTTHTTQTSRYQNIRSSRTSIVSKKSVEDSNDDTKLTDQRWVEV